MDDQWVCRKIRRQKDSHAKEGGLYASSASAKGGPMQLVGRSVGDAYADVAFTRASSAQADTVREPDATIGEGFQGLGKRSSSPCTPLGPGSRGGDDASDTSGTVATLQHQMHELSLEPFTVDVAALQRQVHELSQRVQSQAAQISALQAELTAKQPHKYELAFDIETIDLQGGIVVACTKRLGLEGKTFCFIPSPDRDDQIRDFCEELDDATSITGYNAYRFDLPIIVREFGIDPERADKWYGKLFDLCQLSWYHWRQACKLDDLFRYNGMTRKKTTGQDAANLARRAMDGDQGALRELVEHCTLDTAGTLQLASKANLGVRFRLGGNNRYDVYCRRSKRWTIEPLASVP